MDESIGVLCKTLASFCNHLQSSCDALKQSIERRPIPLVLNRRVCSTSSDLNLLENMSLGTVSFEELLGYCNEVYKKDQSDLSELEDHLRAFGYTPGQTDGNDYDDSASLPNFNDELHYLNKEDRLLRWLLVKHRDMKYGLEFLSEDDGKSELSKLWRSLYEDEDLDEDEDDEDDDEYEVKEAERIEN